MTSKLRELKPRPLLTDAEAKHLQECVDILQKELAGGNLLAFSGFWIDRFGDVYPLRSNTENSMASTSHGLFALIADHTQLISESLEYEE